MATTAARKSAPASCGVKKPHRYRGGISKEFEDSDDSNETDEDSPVDSDDHEMLCEDSLPVPLSTAQRVKETINQEQFDGSFLLTENLCKILGISYEAVKSGWRVAHC